MIALLSREAFPHQPLRLGAREVEESPRRRCELLAGGIGEVPVVLERYGIPAALAAALAVVVAAVD